MGHFCFAQIPCGLFPALLQKGSVFGRPWVSVIVPPPTASAPVLPIAPVAFASLSRLSTSPLVSQDEDEWYNLASNLANCAAGLPLISGPAQEEK